MDDALKNSILTDVKRLETKLLAVQPNNAKKYAFYYGKQAASGLGIKVPRELATCSFALGWAATAVNVLQERTKFTGYYVTGNPELTESLNKDYEDNFMEAVQAAVIRDAYVTGNGYMSVAPGDVAKGEPEVLFMAESAYSVYGEFNPRTGALSNAFKLWKVGTDTAKALFYTETHIWTLNKKGDVWVIDESEEAYNEHGLGVVPMVRFINNADAYHTEGKTVISRPLRSFIWQAMDAMVGTSQTLHYFAYPLRVFLNTAQAMFESDEVAKNNALKVYNEIRDALQVPFNKQDGHEVKVQQLSGNSPEPIFNLMDGYAKLAAREIGVSPSYLGVESINPTAADALDAEERKLVYTVSSFIPNFRRGFKNATKIGLLIKNGEVPADFNNVDVEFMRPATYSPAAAADRALKISSAKIFEQEYPRWFYEQLGLTHYEIKQTLDFVKRKEQAAKVAAIAASIPTGEVATEPPTPTTEITSG